MTNKMSSFSIHSDWLQPDWLLLLPFRQLWSSVFTSDVSHPSDTKPFSRRSELFPFCFTFRCVVRDVVCCDISDHDHCCRRHLSVDDAALARISPDSESLGAISLLCLNEKFYIFIAVESIISFPFCVFHFIFVGDFCWMRPSQIRRYLKDNTDTNRRWLPSVSVLNWNYFGFCSRFCTILHNPTT